MNDDAGGGGGSNAGSLAGDGGGSGGFGGGGDGQLFETVSFVELKVPHRPEYSMSLQKRESEPRTRADNK